MPGMREKPVLKSNPRKENRYERRKSSPFDGWRNGTFIRCARPLCFVVLALAYGVCGAESAAVRVYELVPCHDTFPSNGNERWQLSEELELKMGIRARQRQGM